jgi:hypothetical protein
MGTLALRFSGFGWRALGAWVEMHAFSSNMTTDLASTTPSPICSFATKERLSGHLGLYLNDGEQSPRMSISFLEMQRLA